MKWECTQKKTARILENVVALLDRATGRKTKLVYSYKGASTFVSINGKTAVKVGVAVNMMVASCKIMNVDLSIIKDRVGFPAFRIAAAE